MKLEEPIFILGAARSGTHLLSQCLTEILDVYSLGESYEIWKRSGNYKWNAIYDYVPQKCITSDMVERIRQDFKAVIAENTSTYWMEKTPSNTLRPNLLHASFPQAKFIHIIRDGRDVALSASRKMHGDNRKVSRGSTDTTGASGRYKHLVKYVFSHKLRAGLKFRDLLKFRAKYFEMLLRPLRKSGMWGPRFFGWKYGMKHYSELEVGALQWKASVEAVVNYFSVQTEAQYLEVRYEDLISDPDHVIQRVLNFLGVELPDEISSPVDTSLSLHNWRQSLTSEQQKLIDLHIGLTLRSLGYCSTDTRLEGGGN